MNAYRHWLPLSTLLFACALPLHAQAQMGGMGGMGGGMGGMGGMGRGRGGEGKGPDSRTSRPVATPEPDNFEQIDYRLSLLEDALKLRENQWPAWRAFLGRTRAYAEDVVRERGRETMAVSATQARGLPHIGQAVDAARNRLTALEEVESAARALYAVLAPDQQAAADVGIPAIIAPRRRQGGGAPPAPPAGAGKEAPEPRNGSEPPR